VRILLSELRPEEEETDATSVRGVGPVVAVIRHEGEDEAGRLGVAGLEEFMERKTVAS
jgi:hypothetical protein